MKKKNFDINAFVKPYLPLDNKRKIDDLVRQIQIQQIPISKKLDRMICNNIADENLRFYYDCISPIKPHNISSLRPKKKKNRMFLEGVSNTVTKIKKKGKSIIKGIKKDNNDRKVVINPNSSDYDNQLMKANLSDKYKGYEYGLSDW